MSGCRLSVSSVIASLLVNGCGDDRGEEEPSTNHTAKDVIECLPNGSLVTELTGEIQGSLDWRSENLHCEGMRRPENAGARLKFSGPYVAGDEEMTLTFILGLPSLDEGTQGVEFPTNVTLVEEGSGRFFGTSDTSSCWTDVTHHQPIDENVSTGYRIAGEVYCIAPLAELSGNSSVTFTELRFAGRVDWKKVE